MIVTLSDEQQRNIREMASSGVRPPLIANSLGVALTDLLETAGDEIAKAAMAPHHAVLKSLHAQAVSQKSAAATIFWLRNMCADLLRPVPKEPSKSRRANEPLAPEDFRPIEFDVYCNDGEPNFDV